MWKESELKILTHHGVTSAKKYIRDGFKEKVSHDIVIEANLSEGTVTITSEDFEETVDLIFAKNKAQRPRKAKLSSENLTKEKLISKAEDCAAKRKFAFPEYTYWFESDYTVYEKYEKSILLSRIYKCEDRYDCYVFLKGKRLEDYVRFDSMSLREAKYEVERRIIKMGVI